MLADATYAVQMGFTPESLAIDDPDHPGLRRAGPRAGGIYGGGGVVEPQLSAATDCSAEGSVQPDLRTFGSDTVDLSGLADLQAACAAVRVRGEITDDEAATIRAALDGAVLKTAGGDTLRVRHIADEGFIMRTAGPNRMSLVGPRSSGMNGHGGATSVHADQDVYGTPMAQLMGGRAPELFVHDSPDGSNHDSSMLLVNLWIPLQQITQPLVLADGRTLDRRRHQLRYGLATDSFLERDDELAINDIWTFLHDDSQRWVFRSEMDHRSAHVFNTLSTAHGAAVLPGEDVAEWCYLALEAAEAAASRGDVDELAVAASAEICPESPSVMTPALRRAIEAMQGLLAEAAEDPVAVCGLRREEWIAAAQVARRSVVRMSLEMRLVVTLEDEASDR